MELNYFGTCAFSTCDFISARHKLDDTNQTTPTVYWLTPKPKKKSLGKISVPLGLKDEKFFRVSYWKKSHQVERSWLRVSGTVPKICQDFVWHLGIFGPPSWTTGHHGTSTDPSIELCEHGWFFNIRQSQFVQWCTWKLHWIFLLLKKNKPPKWWKNHRVWFKVKFSLLFFQCKKVVYIKLSCGHTREFVATVWKSDPPNNGQKSVVRLRFFVSQEKFLQSKT